MRTITAKEAAMLSLLSGELAAAQGRRERASLAGYREARTEHVRANLRFRRFWRAAEITAGLTPTHR